MKHKLTDAQLLAAAQELDRRYAEAEAFDAAQARAWAKAHGRTRTVYRINWDNGANACGTFPWTYATEEEAEREAECIEKENRAQDIWTMDGVCEVIECQEPVEPSEEEIEEAHADETLRKAALNRGQP